jgi:hypothetical protein
MSALQLLQAKARLEAVNAERRKAVEDYQQAVREFFAHSTPNLDDERPALEGRALVHVVPGMGVVVVDEDWYERDAVNYERALTFLPDHATITVNGGL